MGRPHADQTHDDAPRADLPRADLPRADLPRADAPRPQARRGRPVASGVERLDEFLFAPVDAQAAAVMRVALAGMIGWSFWSLGLRPAAPVTSIDGAAWWYERVFITSAYAALVLIAVAFFGAGVRPRVGGLALCALLLPLASVNRGQQSRQVLLFSLLAFSMLRSDARWSVRAWLNRNPAQENLARDLAGPIWPIRLMQILLSLVYAINAAAKSTPQYLSGDVLIGMSRMRPNFLIDMSDGLIHAGPLVFPVALAAIASVVIEFYLAIGFWFPRLRWATAVVGVIFHLGLQQIVRIFMLDYVSMFLYLAFLLPWRGPVAQSEESPGSSVLRPGA